MQADAVLLDPTPTRYTERELLDRLHARYAFVRPGTDARRYAVAEHVPLLGQGMAAWRVGAFERIADFLAQDTYTETLMPDGSKGGYGGLLVGRRGEERQQLHGHEVKVSRSDWLAELRDPTKADAWKRYCDRWWLVAPRDVVRDDLPDGWGHIAPTGTGLRVVVRAPLLDPEPMPTTTRAQLMRAVQKTATRSTP